MHNIERAEFGIWSQKRIFFSFFSIVTDESERCRFERFSISRELGVLGKQAVVEEESEAKLNSSSWEEEEEELWQALEEGGGEERVRRGEADVEGPVGRVGVRRVGRPARHHERQRHGWHSLPGSHGLWDSLCCHDLLWLYQHWSSPVSLCPLSPASNSQGSSDMIRYS